MGNGLQSQNSLAQNGASEHDGPDEGKEESRTLCIRAEAGEFETTCTTVDELRQFLSLRLGIPIQNQKIGCQSKACMIFCV